MNAPEEIKALFPPAEQVARVIRTRTVTSWPSDGHTKTRVTQTSTETVCLVITMTARQAAPAHIATYARSTGASRTGSIKQARHYDVRRPRGRDAGVGQGPAGPGGSG